MFEGWVDTHTHLQDARIDDPASLWASAREAGVSATVLAGVDARDWQRQEALTHLPGVYCSAGLHPQRVAELTTNAAGYELAALESWLVARHTDARWVALGEIGLDGVGERRARLPLQRDVFVAQLQLARRLNRPVLLHVLRAHEEALAALRQVGLPEAGGVVHSFSGSPQLVPKYLELGLFLAFGGSLTWAPDNRAAQALAVCPNERLLLETDSPDQTPLARRPALNQPAFLLDVAAAAARIKRLAVDELRLVTTANARELFRFAAERPTQ